MMKSPPAFHRMLIAFQRLAISSPSTRAEMDAVRSLKAFCVTSEAFRNSLPIVVEAFDILSRARRVDSELAGIVSRWIVENHDPRFVKMWLSQMVVVAYAGVGVREEKILSWTARLGVERYGLGQLTADGICALAAAFAKLHFYNYEVFERIMDVIVERYENLSGKQYAVLLHSLASVRYRKGERNPLPGLKDLGEVTVRESSSIIWASATLEWEYDVRILERAMDCCEQSDLSVSSEDVNNMITALAYGGGVSDEKMVFRVVRCSLGEGRYRPTAAYSRQLATLVAEYPRVLNLLEICELARMKDTFEVHQGAKGEINASVMEDAVVKCLRKIAHGEGFGLKDTKEVGWYSVDIIIEGACCCSFCGN